MTLCLHHKGLTFIRLRNRNFVRTRHGDVSVPDLGFLNKEIKMSKVYFSLFQNNGDKASETKYRKYKGKDSAGKAEFDEVTADYRITNTESNVFGSAIKDKSKSGHNVIRVNFSVKDGESKTYYNGTLNLSKNKRSENAPDMFGTASTKDGVEMDMACWFKEDKNGNKYLSCNMQEPYKGGQEEVVVDEDEGSEIPF
jgi:uncharacterized protein (DUF736 family)